MADNDLAHAPERAQRSTAWPRVARLSIAPVRSLGLEHPEAIDLTETGVLEDRRFFLVDGDGRFLDQTRLGRLVQVGAHTDADARRLRLTVPDGIVIDAEVELGATVTTPIFGRQASGREVVGPWSTALSSFAGRTVRLVRGEEPGATRKGRPVSLVSDGSLRRLAEQFGEAVGGEIDARRFRMLIDIEGAAAHEEDTWIGQRIAVGEAILRITKPVARCAITTQDPDTGERDLDTLRAIIAYRGLRDGEHADFGVLGDVERPGRVRLGDEVRVLG